MDIAYTVYSTLNRPFTREPGAAERLLPDDRARRLVVDVEVARAALQLLGSRVGESLGCNSVDILGTSENLSQNLPQSMFEVLRHSYQCLGTEAVTEVGQVLHPNS